MDVSKFNERNIYKGSPPEVFLKKVLCKYAVNLQENTIVKSLRSNVIEITQRNFQ